MGSLNLANLTQEHEYIQKIKKALERATGQQIVSIDIRKVKRVAGASVVPVQFGFTGGQELILFIRAGADVFKAQINTKEIVLSGDFSDVYQPTFDAAVSGVAQLIRNSQAKIQAENTQQKVKMPPRRSASVMQQLHDQLDQEQQLDQTIVNKTLQRDQLIDRLAQVQAQISIP